MTITLNGAFNDGGSFEEDARDMRVGMFGQAIERAGNVADLLAKSTEVDTRIKNLLTEFGALAVDTEIILPGLN